MKKTCLCKCCRPCAVSLLTTGIWPSVIRLAATAVVDCDFDGRSAVEALGDSRTDALTAADGADPLSCSHVQAYHCVAVWVLSAARPTCPSWAARAGMEMA